MRILFFIDELGSGGAQRQMVTLAMELSKQNYEVTFLTYRKSTFYQSVIKQHNIKEINIPEEGGYIKRLFACRKIIRRGKFDVVMAFLEGPCFIASLSSLPFRKWKLILGERSANPQILTSLKQKVYRFPHFLADNIIANSQCNIDMILKVSPFLRNSKCSVIYNLYDINKFNYNNNFNYCSNKRFVLTIASNLKYWKNLDGLIEGVNLLSEEQKNELLIKWYGHEFDIDASKKDGIKKITAYNLEDVFEFHPPTKDIYTVMSNSDAVGLFSHFEGLSNTICEAMALGKPIVTTKVSDNELFIKDRETGFLCDSKNPQDICKAISDLLKSTPQELKRMGKKNRIFFENIFDKEQILRKYIKMFAKKE